MMDKFALKDVRVVDFTWVISGPYATKMLADQGAQVIKIESASTIFAFWYNPAGAEPVSVREIDRGPAYDLLNRNKLSITVNLKTAKGLELVKWLVKVSDVVVENFSATAMKRLGLDYPVLHEVNPKIIMVSMAGFGHAGPYSNCISHGQTLQSMCGVDEITGYPDAGPIDPGFTYLDYAGGAHATLAILAALRHRSRTGQGQYVDLSQFDVGCSLAGLSLLDYAANGRVQKRAGNSHPWASPYGTYRCKGNDRWCTLAVFNDEEWQRAIQVMGNPPWAADPRFATTLGRAGNAAEIDRLVETWTLEHSPEEVMPLMQQNGVEAGIVQTMEDLLTKDKHLETRGLYCEVPHPTRYSVLLEGVPYKASRTPGGLEHAGPFAGEHSEYVCREIIGMSREEFEEYEREGVLT